MTESKSPYKRSRIVPKGVVPILKEIKVNYALADWQLIRLAAAKDHVSMSEWVRRETERAVERLRQGRP